ncbi:di-trans,poly-cis-decaprenylcistransferase [Candidatus Beckwithbacteria bacterium CG23_combo_of_CG06-09_8_20_14_all_47_9]|uniref:Isoprenyl transferase n=1 Tax=Candidatus Beckwithbacteria bacterium CG23_combo_of_CG06-09_8_20_14_all_47_9 TaxID=1974498 RepID=A0A2H0B377_9BACT|nr:MAG: di-trans,poly-cis-decaprenylcistransferase [Candidatus Beckwithbacteria bacterium CG23_combo_of_CG06-09_8_20_14_all_47_9]
MSLPRHIAIICDGNRRWAKNKSLPEFAGHRRAVEVTMEQLIDRCVELKIPYLTFWVFSTENWHRGKSWVDKYFKLLRQLFTKNFQKLHQKNVKLNLIGDVTKLPQDIQDLFNEWLNKTKNNQKLTLTIAINYGGRDEILRAIAKGPFPKHLDTVGLPDPDLLIRTAPNNHRLSGFMLWQIAYTQLYFTDTLFPDFDGKELDKAIAWWQEQTQNLGA